MADFKKAIEAVLLNEGVFSDNPADSGGITKYGISSAAYPHVDIASLTRNAAKGIYRRDYWTPIMGDAIADQVLAANLLDFSVTAGVGTAIKSMQMILRDKFQIDNVVIDGIMGPITVESINNSIPEILNRMFSLFRILYYVKLTYSRPKDHVFVKGWITRVFMFL